MRIAEFSGVGAIIGKAVEPLASPLSSPQLSDPPVLRQGWASACGCSSYGTYEGARFVFKCPAHATARWDLLG